MKNVILISIDNLRFDCIGYQPNKKELAKYDLEKDLNTPTLDSISRNSICFTNAISTNTYTTSAHASIITGLYPPKHGLRAFHDILADKVKTLAEIFKKQGYLTILSTDWLYAWKPYNLHRGFDYIFDRKDKELYEFLNLHKSDKIFLIIHYLDVHEPYLYAEQKIFDNYNLDYFTALHKLCEEYSIECESDKPYDIWRKFSNKIKRDKKILFPLFVKGVNKFDNGRFKEFINYLKNLGYLENSLMVIFSDHGEGKFLEDDINCFSHAGALYDDVIRVPLMIYNKGFSNMIIDRQVSIVDIFPTILNFCFGRNLDIQYILDGKNLLSINNKEEYNNQNNQKEDNNQNNQKEDNNQNNQKEDNRFTYSEVWRYHNNNNRILYQRCIRNKYRKYMIYNIPEIFQDLTIFDMPIEEFIKNLYACYLGREADEQGLENWLKKAYIDNFSKNEILNFFINSEECKNKKFVIFDLNKDPEEIIPLNATDNVISSIEYFGNIKQIFDLEKSAIRSIFNEGGDSIKNLSKEDDIKIKQRLKDLGYLS